MSEPWRTPIVQAVCRKMLDNRKWDALPILADALEEVEYPDAKFLAFCRSAKPEPALAERAVNLVYSDETADAVRWMEDFAEQVSYGEDQPMKAYATAIHAGHEAVKTGEYCWWGENGMDFFYEGEHNRRAFFRNWSIITGVEVPEEKQDEIYFRCAC